MKNIFVKTIILFAIIINIAAVNPKDLVKVNSQNQQACKEYYTYHDEMYCSTQALSSHDIDPEIKKYETLKIVFDDRPWQAAWGKKDEDISAVEYIPMGDNIDNWHELITSQFFPGIQDKTTPKRIASIEMQNLKRAGFNPTIHFITDTPNDVMFEFQIDSPKNQIQDELQRITKGEKGIYILHYVIKKNDMGDEARKKWEKNLSDSKIK